MCKDALDSELIIGDPDRLKGVLLNLYSNAAKFTASGFICVRIWKYTPGPEALPPPVQPERSYRECIATLDQHDIHLRLDAGESPWWLAHLQHPSSLVNTATLDSQRGSLDATSASLTWAVTGSGPGSAPGDGHRGDARHGAGAESIQSRSAPGELLQRGGIEQRAAIEQRGGMEQRGVMEQRGGIEQRGGVEQRGGEQRGVIEEGVAATAGPSALQGAAVGTTGERRREPARTSFCESAREVSVRAGGEYGRSGSGQSALSAVSQGGVSQSGAREGSTSGLAPRDSDSDACCWSDWQSTSWQGASSGESMSTDTAVAAAAASVDTGTRAAAASAGTGSDIGGGARAGLRDCNGAARPGAGSVPQVRAACVD